MIKILAMMKKYRTLLLYAAIGMTALVIELAAFYVFLKPAGLSIAISNALAMGLGFFLSFTLNAVYNFQVRDRLLSRLIRYGAITIAGYFISTLLILILVDYLHLPALLAKLLSLPVFFAFQYSMNSRFTFNAANDKQEAAAL